jgi:arsenite-transporting ATPase
MRTILFTGKGGVGKTTLASATALQAAAVGYDTLVMSTDIAHSLADAFGTPLGNEPVVLGPRLWGAELDTGEELERYWGEVKRKLAAALREEGIEGAVAGELAILPGLDELLSLVRVKRYCDEGQFDVIVIDSAPTGAAMRLLSAPDINRWYARNATQLMRGLSRLLVPMVQSLTSLPITERSVHRQVADLFEKVEDLRRMFTDPAQTSVRLVLNPERMSIRETQRAYTYFCLFGLAVDALYVNRVLPPQVTDPYFEGWKADQVAYRDEVRALFAPLPVFEVALRPREVMGKPALERLAADLYGERDPVPPLSQEQPLEFHARDGRYTLSLRLSGVQGGAIGLEKQGDELRVQLGSYRRVIALPSYVVGMQPTWAHIEGERLVVVFEEDGP